MKNEENSKNLIKIGLLLLGIGIMFSCSLNTISAASTSNVYVNTHGDDTWNGLNSTWVKGTLNGPKATIKNATATVKSGGIVYIANGTYNENNIQINNDMTIIGSSQEKTIINGGKLAGKPATIFTILSGVNVNINNLTIENGYSNDGLGGAINNNNGTLTVNKITFKDNSAMGLGGAIFNTGNLNVNSCTLNNNTALRGDGGAIFSTGNTNLKGNTFLKNTAPKGYGGAIAYEPEVSIAVAAPVKTEELVKITEPTEKVKTATTTKKDTDTIIASITNCIFTNNSALNGGAVYSEDNLTIKNSTFTNNSAMNGNGGGVAYEQLRTLAPAKPVEAKAVAAAKSAPTAPVETSIRTINASIISCTFINNTALNGGAIENEVNMTIRDSKFINNMATYGGAILNGNNLTVTGSTFESNNASNDKGGAIYNGLPLMEAQPVKDPVKDPVKAKAVAMLMSASNSTDNGPYLHVAESSFVGNSAVNGGAIVNTGDANINFSRFIGNSAINGSAIFNSGNLMDASLNWWGTNIDPSINVYGNVTVTPWLIFKMITSPKIFENGASNVTAVLLYDSNGIYHDPANGKLQDGIPVTFAGSNGNFNPTSGILVDGQARSLFTVKIEGKTNIKTTIDNQTVSIFVIAYPQPTSENSTNPQSNSNINTNSTNRSNIIKTIKAIPLQHTGVPFAGLILAIITVIGGTIIPRRK